MDQFTPQDTHRYEKIKKEASSSVLKFRANARRSSEEYQGPMRRLLERTNTKETSTYLLFNEWFTRIAPEVESLEAARRSTSLRNTLAKQLHLSSLTATDLAKRLGDERISSLNSTFLDLCYGPGRARTAAFTLLSLPSEEIINIRDRFVSYQLYKLVADELGITFYDGQASLFRRLYLKNAERRQIKGYKKRQAKRLKTITSRQEEIKAHNSAIISRILSVDLDTAMAFTAYEQYKKRLEKIEPGSLTAAKRLSLFTAATKKIIEAQASKQSTTRKLADLQNAQKATNDVLVELFDMTNAQRKILMDELKEYRDLEHEADRITKEQKQSTLAKVKVPKLNSAH